MPTPSEENSTAVNPLSEWSAAAVRPSRSVFGNYRKESPERESAPSSSMEETAGERRPSASNSLSQTASLSLQAAIDRAVARSFVYRFLAKAWEDPSHQGWSWLTQAQTLAALRSANAFLGASGFPSAQDLFCSFKPDRFDAFHSACVAAFGHAARGPHPLNEIEYGDLKADPLFQPHRLADLAAFYRAFGLELAPDSDERHDHLCLELEFMCVLAAKEAYALEHQLDAHELALCREAQKKFLREHLGRWTPAFARRLTGDVTEDALKALAQFTRVFVECECARFAVNPGAEDLLLRPVDTAAESLCGSCGLTQLPPGALPAT